MTDTNKLAELIKKAKTKMWGKTFHSELERNMFVADYLLSNGVIVPPCKVGALFRYGLEHEPGRSDHRQKRARRGNSGSGKPRQKNRYGALAGIGREDWSLPSGFSKMRCSLSLPETIERSGNPLSKGRGGA